MLDVNRIRQDFPILQQLVKGKPLVYLDSGASSQKFGVCDHPTYSVRVNWQHCIGSGQLLTDFRW